MELAGQVWAREDRAVRHQLTNEVETESEFISPGSAWQMEGAGPGRTLEDVNVKVFI